MPVYYDNYTSTMQNFYSQNGSLGEAVQNSLSPSENKCVLFAVFLYVLCCACGACASNVAQACEERSVIH